MAPDYSKKDYIAQHNADAVAVGLEGFSDDKTMAKHKLPARCENCLWGIEIEDIRKCHRFPPIVVPMKDRSYDKWDWPMVQDNDFCGEWRKATIRG